MSEATRSLLRSEPLIVFQALEGKQFPPGSESSPLRAAVLLDGVEQDSTSVALSAASTEVHWLPTQAFTITAAGFTNLVISVRDEKHGLDIGSADFARESLIGESETMSESAYESPASASGAATPAALSHVSSSTSVAGGAIAAMTALNSSLSPSNSSSARSSRRLSENLDVLARQSSIPRTQQAVHDEWLFLEMPDQQPPAKVRVEITVHPSAPRGITVRVVDAQTTIAKAKGLYLSLRLMPQHAPMGGGHQRSRSIDGKDGVVKTKVSKDTSPSFNETFTFPLHLTPEAHWLEINLYEAATFSGDTQHAAGMLPLAGLAPNVTSELSCILQRKTDKKKDKADKNKRASAFGLGTMHVNYYTTFNKILPLECYQDLLKLFVPGHVGENKAAPLNILPASSKMDAASKRRRTSLIGSGSQQQQPGAGVFTLTTPAVLAFAARCAESKSFSDSVMAVFETQDLALSFLKAAVNIEVTAYLVSSSSNKNLDGFGANNSASAVTLSSGAASTLSLSSSTSTMMSALAGSTSATAPMGYIGGVTGGATVASTTLLGDLSITAQFIESYMRVVGKDYISGILRSLLRQLHTFGKIAPTKGDDMVATIRKHWKPLEAICKSVVDAVVHSLDECPAGLRLVLCHLQRLALDRLGSEMSASRAQQLADKVVNELFFTRFLCNALERPRAYGVHPSSERNVYTLVLVARILHVTAETHHLRDAREGYGFASSFMGPTRARLRKFTTSLATASGDFSLENGEMSSMAAINNAAAIDLERELANIYRLFQFSLDAASEPELSGLAGCIAVMTSESGAPDSAPSTTATAATALALGLPVLSLRAIARLEHVLSVLACIDDNIRCAKHDPTAFYLSDKAQNMMGLQVNASDAAMSSFEPADTGAELSVSPAHSRQASESTNGGAATLAASSAPSAPRSSSPTEPTASSNANQLKVGTVSRASSSHSELGSTSFGSSQNLATSEETRIGPGSEFNNRLETLIDEIVEGVRQLKANADQSKRDTFTTLASSLADSVGKVVGLINALNLEQTAPDTVATIFESREFLCDNMIVLRQAASRAATATQHREVAVQYMIDSAFVVVRTLRTLTQGIDSLDAELVTWRLEDASLGRFSTAFSRTLSRKVRSKNQLNTLEASRTRSIPAPTFAAVIAAAAAGAAGEGPAATAAATLAAALAAVSAANRPASGAAAAVATAAVAAAAASSSTLAQPSAPVHPRRYSKMVAPPTGRVTLIFTDIENSSALWERDPVLTRAAVKMHNHVMRSAMQVCNGYEVKTEGDAFMIAFQRAVDAVKFCLIAQLDLLSVNWPEEILALDGYSQVFDGDNNTVFRGLRVRMGIHTGEPDCEPDPITYRMDYFGPVVNRAARVSSVAEGGQIVMSRSAMEDCRALADELKLFDPVYVELGSFKLKGLGSEETLFQVLPLLLRARTFELAQKRRKPTNDENVKLVFNLMLDKQNAEVPPPQGHVAIVFADVQHSLQLWHAIPDAMRAAVKLYKDCMRRAIRVHKGYEVKTEGDAFMVAFQRSEDAVKWCLETQTLLLTLDWPKELLDSQYCWERRSPDGQLLQRGLSIRMGVHSGSPESETDPVVERMDYFGPMVNRAARVSELTDGGQVVVSGSVSDDIRPALDAGAFAAFVPVLTDLGSFRFKELDTTERLVQILPSALSGRIFKKLPTESDKFRPSVTARKHLSDLLGELGDSGAEAVYPAPSRSPMSTAKLERMNSINLERRLGSDEVPAIGSTRSMTLMNVKRPSTSSLLKSSQTLAYPKRPGAGSATSLPITASSSSSLASLPDSPGVFGEDTCGGCGVAVDEEGGETWLLACGRKWHYDHFGCRKCKMPFELTPYIEHKGHPYCEKDYYEMFGKRCFKCRLPIVGEMVFAIDNQWHQECFNCEVCKKNLKDQDFLSRNGFPYCEADYAAKFFASCHACKKQILDEVVSALGSRWHVACFVCQDCKTPLADQTFYAHEKSPRCQSCTLKWVKQRGKP
ncbi:hypothetical protein CAOG_00254 [Capsaspora owczarzaki ATCC 30864]|uniref:Adenylate cyclase n=1 Tax=Capsaspora owczarzaki (strain ATCC 30864) TaxID=595528 RepID=A0A0D2WI82_CAPO3|nr:hypothetical protein CAOG_00254 [Capsaspora owczarzaki ATCC 30864]KJE88628.1 hypothetical protein CAOG_000254 [Capsaspora owczarzaki ATCC 30864]|eukprot:XP_004365125.1 hypothetical protein CAOG_00254 [Capsaspora owczarzaki ATCC 30864]